MNSGGGSPAYEETNIGADTINCIRITTNNSLYCTSSWDGDVRCYGIQINGKAIQSSFKTSVNIGVPATTCCWTPDNSQIVIGGADGKVYLWNVTSGSTQLQQIAQHNIAMISTTFNNTSNCLIEGSIDCDVRVYDLRTPQQCMNLRPAGCLTAMCSNECNTNIGLSSGNDTFQYTLSNPSTPFDQIKENPGDVVTSICYTPNRYFAAGMTNGIVRVKFQYAEDTVDGKHLRFRIGRKEGFQYGCSCVASYNPSEHLLTAADDESLILWGVRERNKIGVYEQSSRTNPYSITACSFSYDGSILIYSKGYNWNFGYPGSLNSKYKCHYDNKLFLRLPTVPTK